MSTVIRPQRWHPAPPTGEAPARPFSHRLQTGVRAAVMAVVALLLVAAALSFNWPHDPAGWRGLLSGVPARFLILAAFIAAAGLVWQRARNGLELSTAPRQWRSAAMGAVTLCLSLASLSMALALLLPDN